MSQQLQQQPFPKNPTPAPYPAPCPASCLVPKSGGCFLANQGPRAQSPCSMRSQGQPHRATRRKPRCLQGDTYYHCKEEEC